MMDASVTVTVDSHGNLVRLPFPQALRRSGPMVSLMRIGRFHYWGAWAGVSGAAVRVQAGRSGGGERRDGDALHRDGAPAPQGGRGHRGLRALTMISRMKYYHIKPLISSPVQ
jgi:hypothetical protein